MKILFLLMTLIIAGCVTRPTPNPIPEPAPSKSDDSGEDSIKSYPMPAPMPAPAPRPPPPTCDIMVAGKCVMLNYSDKNGASGRSYGDEEGAQ